MTSRLPVVHAQPIPILLSAQQSRSPMPRNHVYSEEPPPKKKKQKRRFLTHVNPMNPASCSNHVLTELQLLLAARPRPHLRLHHRLLYPHLRRYFAAPSVMTAILPSGFLELPRSLKDEDKGFGAYHSIPAIRNPKELNYSHNYVRIL